MQYKNNFRVFYFYSFRVIQTLITLKYNSVDGIWHKDSIQYFSFELDSRENLSYKSFINLRIDEKYPFNNIFLIVSLEDSSNILSIDTLEYKLADKYGNFTGNKRINIVENSLLHKENISLVNKKNIWFQFNMQ